jgi:hypothetical protein
LADSSEGERRHAIRRRIEVTGARIGAITERSQILARAKRRHPYQGGIHHDFLRVKDAYNRTLAVWAARRRGGASTV